MKKMILYGFKYIFKFKFLYFTYLILQVFLNLLNLILPIIEGLIVDCLVRMDILYFKNNIIILILVMLSSLILSSFSAYLYFKLQVICGNASNLDEIHNLYSISYTHLLNKDPSELNQAINNDCNNIIIFCLNSIQRVLMVLFSLGFMIYIVFKQSYVFAVILIISLFMYIIIYHFYKQKLYETNKKVLEQTSDYFGALYQLVYYLKSVKMCSLYENMMKFEKKIFNQFFEATRQSQLLECRNTISVNLISYLSQIFIYIYGFVLIFNGNMTVGMLITISNYCNCVISNAQEVIDFGNSVQKCKASYNRLEEYHISSRLNGTQQIKKVENIAFENVSYGYPNQKKLFCYTGCLDKGNIYRIMGNNGAGKSTFLQLLLGIYGSDYKGNIFINGIKIQNIDMNQFVKKNVAICLQEPFIFEDTILNNLAPNEYYTKDCLRELLDGFDMTSVISKLDKGIQTVLHPLNLGLSGGEKQKIGIIRVLLSNADVLIFDEPTAALDKQSCLFFQNYIKNINNKIVIVISHDDLDILEDQNIKLVIC